MFAPSACCPSAEGQNPKQSARGMAQRFVQHAASRRQLPANAGVTNATMIQAHERNGKALLEVKGLRVSVDETEILRGINLTVRTGEVHAIMGPNGSGKSTLTNVLAGRPEYTVTEGQVLFEGKNLLGLPPEGMDPETRAREGMFLAFQYPVELAGVRTWQFLKAAVDATREYRGLPQLKIREFDRLLEEKLELVEIAPELVKRSVNEGFSGGEKKRNEILQMLLWTRSSPCWTRPIRDSTSTPCGSWPTASTSSKARQRPSFSSRTTSGFSTTSRRTSSTFS